MKAQDIVVELSMVVFERSKESGMERSAEHTVLLWKDESSGKNSLWQMNVDAELSVKAEM